ncbi:MFS transporter [Kribbella sp. NPDC058245]|uniref:MFS transporter n=1 Tax=Kribbella sp. NPDC058245 TaxID=3346399 RepID=UPI0036E6D7F1
MSGQGTHSQAAAQQEPLLNRQMVMLLLTVAGAMASFYLLLSVIPLSAATGGSGGVAAGLATGAMMLSTVLTELLVPRLVARLGYRGALSLGLVLLGVPALALPGTSSVPLLLSVCLARGAGLGIIVVAGAALAAELAPVSRLGEALGIYGVASAIPSIVFLPLGLWSVPHTGYGPVFVGSAVVACLALLAVLGLPSLSAKVERHSSVLPGFRVGRLTRPVVVFSAITLAAGVWVTFLALAMPAEIRQWAPVALLVQSVATPTARWGAGRFGDRFGSGGLLVPAVVAAGAGAGLSFWVAHPIAVVVGMALFGIGFGIAQNVTLALMYARSSRAEYGRVSAMWNLGYDGGMGIGAVGFGFLTEVVPYPIAFAVVAAVVFAALLPACLDLSKAKA